MFKRFLVSFATFFVTITAVNGQESDKKSPWYEAISLHGFLSAAYSYNFNIPDTMTNQYRVFDFDDNSMKIDVVGLSVRKDVVKPNETGFRIDVTAGSSVPKVAHSAGLDAGDLDFQQMLLSYIVPVGSGVRLDVGKFITGMGYEVIEGVDNHNDNYSRSFLFGYAIPFTHTGVKASYTFGENITALLMVANGWDNAIDNNKSKSVCSQIGIVPIHGLSFYTTYMVGPEKSGNNTDDRHVLDLAGSFTFNENVTIGLNGDYGKEEHSGTNGGTATWIGVAGYARLNLLNTFSISLRSEQFEDRDGIRTGTVQKLREVTMTPEYRPAEQVVVRGDLRFDISDKVVFERGSGWKDAQTTLSLNFLYTF